MFTEVDRLNDVRRWANLLGHYVRARRGQITDGYDFALIDSRSVAVLGHNFDASLDQIENYLQKYQQSLVSLMLRRGLMRDVILSHKPIELYLMLGRA